MGIGGAGLNAVNAMIGAGVGGVEFVGVSLTEARLGRSRAATDIRFGTETRFGTGGDPETACGTELVNECGYIYADFNDLKTVMALRRLVVIVVPALLVAVFPLTPAPCSRRTSKSRAPW